MIGLLCVGECVVLSLRPDVPCARFGLDRCEISLSELSSLLTMTKFDV